MIHQILFKITILYLSGKPTLGFLFTQKSFIHLTKDDSSQIRSTRDRINWFTPVNERNLNTGVHLRALSSATAIVSDFYQSAPYLAAFLTCGVKASAADFVAQRSAQGSADSHRSDDQHGVFTTITSNTKESVEKIDIARNTAFILYGGLYQGITQEFIFNHVYPLLFGFGTDITTVATKVVFDMVVLSPFVCLPAAYLMKGLIFQELLMDSLRHYYDDVMERGLILKYWMVWAPVQCLTFSIIPEHLRITFIALVSFFWLILLSAISAESDERV